MDIILPPMLGRMYMCMYIVRKHLLTQSRYSVLKKREKPLLLYTCRLQIQRTSSVLLYAKKKHCNDVFSVRTIDFQANIYKIREERNDKWSRLVVSRRAFDRVACSRCCISSAMQCKLPYVCTLK